MPIVAVQITEEGTTKEQKAEIIRDMTEVLCRVLNKRAATTHVVIQEVDTGNWGVGGLPALEYRRRLAEAEESRQSAGIGGDDHRSTGIDRGRPIRPQ